MGGEHTKTARLVLLWDDPCACTVAAHSPCAPPSFPTDKEAFKAITRGFRGATGTLLVVPTVGVPVHLHTGGIADRKDKGIVHFAPVVKAEEGQMIY